MREDNIHYAIRQFLKKNNWTLIAGQYPNGSDDELPPLNVVDPFLARDNSPDPRRHSKNKYVPDLVACKREIMFIIEMKPLYSVKDEEKLGILLTKRRRDLVSAIEDLAHIRGVEITCPIQSIIFVPCLGFGTTSRYFRNQKFCYFKVKDLSTVIFEGNSVVPNISEPSDRYPMKTDKLSKKVQSLDWECELADTQYLTHAIHRYSGKFIPQMARQAMELITKPGDLVVDPYCGSGTTMLECALGRRRSIGIDLNPLAVLIAKVKTTPVNREQAIQLIQELEDDLKVLLENARQPSLFKPIRSMNALAEEVYTDPRWNDAWYKKWFKDGVRFELIAIHQRIINIKHEALRNIVLVAFSDILRKCSNANGSYPNVMYDKDRGIPSAATPQFLAKLRELWNAVAKLEGAGISDHLPLVLTGNTRLMPIGSGTVDAIITHPPYIGSIPYAEYGILSLVWLGHDPKKLDRSLTGGKRQAKDVVERYRTDFRGMIEESWRVLKPGGVLFMLLGNPMVKGKRIDLADMAKEVAHPIGFKLIVVHYRNGINRRANLMGREALLFFQKP